MTKEIATLYFVLSKVQMPFLDENIFKFVLSIGDSIITLRSPRFKKGMFSMPYKIKKEVFPKSDSNPAYRSLKIQIFIVDQINDITNSGVIKIKPEDFLNKSPINLEPHVISIENIDVTITFGLSLMKGNSQLPSNFNEFPSSTKELSVEQRKRKEQVSPQKEETNDINNEELELLEDDIEEEEVKEKIKITEPKQTDDSRRHRHHRTEQNSDRRSSSSSSHSPSGSSEGESGRRHRRKVTEQNDQNSSGDNHSHRHRSHDSQEGSGEGERRHRRKRTDETETQQNNEVQEVDGGRKHRKKRVSSGE